MTDIIRGAIYKYKNEVQGNEYQRYVLVISDQRRCNDNRISVLFISNPTIGHDAIDLEIPSIADSHKCVHCGLVTYVKRTDILEPVGYLPEYAMLTIGKTILSELGLGMAEFLAPEEPRVKDVKPSFTASQYPTLTGDDFDEECK